MANISMIRYPDSHESERDWKPQHSDMVMMVTLLVIMTIMFMMLRTMMMIMNIHMRVGEPG